MLPTFLWPYLWDDLADMNAIIEGATLAFLLSGYAGSLTASIFHHGVGELQAQMSPTSSFLSSLNSDTALAREAQQMAQRRIGITSAVPLIGGYMCGLVVDQAICSETQYGIADLYLFRMFFYLYFNDPDDPDYLARQLHAIAVWYPGFQALDTFDDKYCGFYTGSVGFCAGDSIVPLWSQSYPGGSNELISPGPNHIKETASTIVYDRINFHLSPTGVLAIP